jgi:hypothetical protein
MIPVSQGVSIVSTEKVSRVVVAVDEYRCYSLWEGKLWQNWLGQPRPGSDASSARETRREPCTRRFPAHARDDKSAHRKPTLFNPEPTATACERSLRTLIVKLIVNRIQLATSNLDNRKALVLNRMLLPPTSRT